MSPWSGPRTLSRQEPPNRFADRLAVGPAATFGMSAFMTRPMSDGSPAPVSAIALARAAASISAAVSAFGRYRFEDGDLALLFLASSGRFPWRNNPIDSRRCLTIAASTLRIASSGRVPPCGISFRVTASISRFCTARHRHPQSRKGQGVTLLGRRLHILMQLFLESNQRLPGHLLQFLQARFHGSQRLLLLLDAGLFIMFPLAISDRIPAFSHCFLNRFSTLSKGSSP